jgi:polysaccharide export outer membrane protein
MTNTVLRRGLYSALTMVALMVGHTQGSVAQQQQPDLTSISYQSPGIRHSGYGDYLLGPADQITLSVMGYPEFAATHVILPDGNINVPLLGPLTIAGKTLSQVNQELTYRLKYYLVDPVVNTELAVLRPVVVTIAGEVHRPGPVQLTGLTSNNAVQNRDLTQTFTEGLPTLSAAIRAAGGVTRTADIREVMIRRILPDGDYQDVAVNLWEAIQAEGTGAGFGLRDGDMIFVPQLYGDDLDRRLIASSTLAPDQIRVRVVGEVRSPGEVLVSPNSSVSGALAAAGGPTNDAQLGNVALVRMGEDGEITQQVLDLSHLIDNQQIQDGDVVMVAKKGYLNFFDTLGRVLNPFNIISIFGL